MTSACPTAIEWRGGRGSVYSPEPCNNAAVIHGDTADSFLPDISILHICIIDTFDSSSGGHL